MAVKTLHKYQHYKMLPHFLDKKQLLYMYLKKKITHFNTRLQKNATKTTCLFCVTKLYNAQFLLEQFKTFQPIKKQMLRKMLNCYNVQIFKHLRDKACHLESVKNGGFQ